MKATFILCIATVLIGLTEIAWGHFPEGATFLAFQWPPGQEPVLDGDLGEWEIVPDEYVLNTMEYLPRGIFRDVSGTGDLIGSLHLPEEVYYLKEYGVGVVWTGWSRTQNALYIAARVFDDEHVTAYPRWEDPAFMWRGDYFDIKVDADHSGGIYAAGSIYANPAWLDRDAWKNRHWEIKREFWDDYGAQATDYGITWPAPIPTFVYTAASWVRDPPWFEASGEYRDQVIGEELTRYERDLIQDPRIAEWFPLWNATTYELKIIPFDRIDWRGPDQSVVHTLREGEIIGLNYAFGDGLDSYAPKSGPTPISYRLLSSRSVTTGSHMWDASRFSDFLLAPVDRNVFEETPVQNTTWGRIKGSFNHR